MLNAADAADVNLAAVFHPGAAEWPQPHIEIAGMLVFAYVDPNGTLRVSVHLDTTEPRVLDGSGLVPMCVVVEDAAVYDSETDPN